MLKDKYNHSIVLLIATVLFLSPLLYVGILQDPSTLPRYSMLSGGVAIMISILALKFFNGEMKIYFTPVVFLLIVYLCFACISSLWAIETSNNFVYIVQLFSLVLFLFAVLQISTINSIRLFLYVSLFSAGISALIGIAQNLGFNVFDLRGPRMGGTFGYKNHAALYLDLIIPIGLMLIVTSETKLLRWLSVISLITCVVYIFMSHTRGSYVALFFSGFLLLVACLVFPDIRRIFFDIIVKLKFVLLFLLFGAILLSFLPGKTDEVLNRPVYAGDKIDISTRDRLTAYSNSLSLFKESPILGSGYGTFWKAFRPYNNHPKVMLRTDENLVMYRLHSDPLQILIELGIIGISLFTLIFVWTFVIGIKLIRADTIENEKLLVLGMLLGLSAALVHSLVDFPFLKPSSSIQIWLYVGLLSGLYAKKTKKFTVITSTTITVLFGIMAVLVTIISVIFFRSFLVGNYHLRLAEKNFNKKDCSKSVWHIEKSLKEFRHDFFAHKVRVNLHISCTKSPTFLHAVLSDELNWDDTNTMALKWRGYLYLNAKKLVLAEKDFKKLSYLLPHKSSGPIGEAYVLFESGKIQQANDLLVRFDKKYPGDKNIQVAIDKIENKSWRINRH